MRFSASQKNRCPQHREYEIPAPEGLISDYCSFDTEILPLLNRDYRIWIDVELPVVESYRHADNDGNGVNCYRFTENMSTNYGTATPVVNLGVGVLSMLYAHNVPLNALNKRYWEHVTRLLQGLVFPQLIPADFGYPGDDLIAGPSDVLKEYYREYWKTARGPGNLDVPESQKRPNVPQGTTYSTRPVCSSVYMVFVIGGGWVFALPVSPFDGTCSEHIETVRNIWNDGFYDDFGVKRLWATVMLCPVQFACPVEGYDHVRWNNIDINGNETGINPYNLSRTASPGVSLAVPKERIHQYEIGSNHIVGSIASSVLRARWSAFTNKNIVDAWQGVSAGVGVNAYSIYALNDYPVIPEDTKMYARGVMEPFSDNPYIPQGTSLPTDHYIQSLGDILLYGFIDWNNDTGISMYHPLTEETPETVYFPVPIDSSMDIVLNKCNETTRAGGLYWIFASTDTLAMTLFYNAYEYTSETVQSHLGADVVKTDSDDPPDDNEDGRWCRAVDDEGNPWGWYDKNKFPSIGMSHEGSSGATTFSESELSAMERHRIATVLLNQYYTMCGGAPEKPVLWTSVQCCWEEIRNAARLLEKAGYTYFTVHGVSMWYNASDDHVNTFCKYRKLTDKRWLTCTKCKVVACSGPGPSLKDKAAPHTRLPLDKNGKVIENAGYIEVREMACNERYCSGYTTPVLWGEPIPPT